MSESLSEITLFTSEKSLVELASNSMLPSASCLYGIGFEVLFVGYIGLFIPEESFQLSLT